jgi:tetratricopeptide (TPR) repeat protein
VWFRFKMNLAAGCGNATRDGEPVREVYLDPHGWSQDLDELNELLVEARLSMGWREYARAADLWKQALAVAGEDANVTLRADIMEATKLAKKRREQCEERLTAWVAAVEEQPENAESHFRLGLIFSALGEGEGALREYEAALRNPDGLCRECFRDLWNNIGWQHFRKWADLDTRS